MERAGALGAWCTCAVELVAIALQEWAYLQVGRNRPDLLAANPANLAASWAFAFANLGLSCVVLSAAAMVVKRFPLAACTGALLLLASHVALDIDYLGMTTAGSEWMNRALGHEDASLKNTVIGDDVTQMCLLFVVDWLQVLGSALLGALFWHMNRGGRRAACAFFGFSVWAFLDLLCNVIMPLDIQPVSELVFCGLSIALCVTVALWLTERARERTCRGNGVAAWKKAAVS
ncbi:MAG TPA: hypothetical protein VGD78_17875 [Chthoniobacterales bacterium]